MSNTPSLCCPLVPCANQFYGFAAPPKSQTGHEHPHTEERSPHFSKVLAAPHQQGASDCQLIAPLIRRCHPSIDTAILPFAPCFGTAYDAVKVKILLLSTLAFSLYISSPCCLAQEVPTIYLSPSETAKAKQAVQDFKSAGERNNRAITAWRSFQQGYQAAHPELPGLRFTSDFRIAFTLKNVNTSSPWEAEAVAIELSAEERQKAESLYREMLEARRVADQAQRNWSDYWHELVLDHAPASPGSAGMIVTLLSGKSGTIPNLWSGGVVFTPDFRVAVLR